MFRSVFIGWKSISLLTFAPNISSLHFLQAKVCEKKGECYGVMEARFHAYCGGTYMYMNLLHVGLGPQMTEDENFCFTN